MEGSDISRVFSFPYDLWTVYVILYIDPPPHHHRGFCHLGKTRIEALSTYRNLLETIVFGMEVTNAL